MAITRFLHTAVLVSDLQQAEQFYGTVLGLPKVERSLKYPGVWYQVGDYQLHLMVDESWNRSLQSEKWGRNPHMALAVTDLEAVKQALISQGYAIQTSASGRAALFTQDPDGNVVELSQAVEENAESL